MTPPTWDARLGRHLPALLALAVAVGVVYANAFSAGFVLDSRVIILENPRVHATTFENVRLLLSDDYWQPFATDGLYRPLTTLSFLFNYAVLGNAERPFWYHAVNLLLHAGCAMLVYGLIWHVARRLRPALIAGLLFAVHPVASEAVTNLVGRADLLAAIGVLGGLFCHAQTETSDDPDSDLWAVGLLLATVIAFFSKETGLTLVGAMLAYDLLLGRRLNGRHYGTVGALMVLYLGVRWWVARSGLPAEDVSPVDNPIVDGGSIAGVLTAVKVLGREMWLLVWPATLSADYSWRAIPVVGWPPGVDVAAVLGLVALGALGVAALVLRAVPGLVFLVAFLGLTILPTSNLLMTIGSIMAERFLYLPLAGFAGAVALIADEIGRRVDAAAQEAGRDRRYDLTAATVVVLLLCGARTWARNADWTDELHLWSSAVGAVPESAKAHKGLAAALFAADVQRERMETVLAHAERAVALREDYEPALVDLGSYYVVAGDKVANPRGDDPVRGAAMARAWYEKSVAVLERARELDLATSRRFAAKMVARGVARESLPDRGDDILYQNLSTAYLRAGRLEDALEAAEQSRRFEPSNLTRYLDVAAILTRLGRWEEAAVALFEAITIDPDQREAPNRLVELYRTFYAGGHAIAEQGADHVVVNLDDPAVRAHRCRGFEGLVRIYTRAKRVEQAARFRSMLAQQCVRAADAS